jgi:hypothetical protein
MEPVWQAFDLRIGMLMALINAIQVPDSANLDLPEDEGSGGSSTSGGVKLTPKMGMR